MTCSCGDQWSACDTPPQLQAVQCGENPFAWEKEREKHKELCLAMSPAKPRGQIPEAPESKTLLLDSVSGTTQSQRGICCFGETDPGLAGQNTFLLKWP